MSANSLRDGSESEKRNRPTTTWRTETVCDDRDCRFDRDAVRNMIEGLRTEGTVQAPRVPTKEVHEGIVRTRNVL
ncbi:hypothetical protein M378DRAFT_156987 [Amanita muscaria Koide BX008]|uniref:Uncharacterized protein n=1 Tax=Amanita muscaria (strain Koide BX008) TaxID=946122 RepID=A0A0C2T1R5_AMAMK|nr:hypothetical protein M378DRAFT_156987 [Amanita muscaria Koide BX008]